MPRFNAKEKVAFSTTMLAGAAFLVGAVRIWNVPTERLLGYLGLALLMLVTIIGLAGLLLGLRLLIGRLTRRHRD